MTKKDLFDELLGTFDNARRGLYIVSSFSHSAKMTEAGFRVDSRYGIIGPLDELSAYDQRCILQVFVINKKPFSLLDMQTT